MYNSCPLRQRAVHFTSCSVRFIIDNPVYRCALTFVRKLLLSHRAHTAPARKDDDPAMALAKTYKCLPAKPIAHAHMDNICKIRDIILNRLQRTQCP